MDKIKSIKEIIGIKIEGCDYDGYEIETTNEK
jgi:hypothetical protein